MKNKCKFICIAGKNDIAVDVLNYIFYRKYENIQIGIVCNKTESGIDRWQKSLRKCAKQLGVREYELDEMYIIDNLLFVSLEFDQIIKPERFRNARLYNIHFSLLPAYKGMYTSAIPILNGEKETGVTLHCIDSGIDTGDIIEQRKFRIRKDYRARDVYSLYIKYGTKVVIDNIDKLIDNAIVAQRQLAEGSTYYSKKAINYSQLRIDLLQTAENISNQLRAFNFREYQLPIVYGKVIIDSKILDKKTPGRVGDIIDENRCGMCISTIDYDIFLFYDRFAELLEACRIGDLLVVREICQVSRHINEKNEKGWSPIIVATYNGHLSIVEYLISVGADIYDKNYNGTNLLMYAKEYFLTSGDSRLLTMYLNMGVSISETDNKGYNFIDYLERAGYALDDFIE